VPAEQDVQEDEEPERPHGERAEREHWQLGNPRKRLRATRTATTTVHAASQITVVRSVGFMGSG
jgi:hypothetical protein